MHARLLSAPSSAAASSSSLPFAGGHLPRASWKPRPGRISASPPPPSLRARASMHPAPSEGGNNPPVHGVSNTVVGVLGVGQLGVKMAILDPLENCPASSICHEHVVGSFDDGDTVREFAKRCGVLTVEIEHVDAVTLEKLEKQGVDCEPKASTIMIIQDKYRQKDHFSKFGIPLTDFVEVDTLSSIEKAGETFGYPLMVKSKRLAYDGQGNAVAHNKKELSSVVVSLGGFEHGLYVERWTPFVKFPMQCFPSLVSVHMQISYHSSYEALFDGLVKIWSISSGECIHEVSSNGNKFHSCVFHPSYTNLLVIGGYQSLELWNMVKNQSMTVQAHEGLIAALAQSPVTGMVVSASHDNSVKLWK